MPRSAPPLTLADGRVVQVAVTDVTDGDLSVHAEGPGLAARRRRVADRPWTWLHQTHGADVHVVSRPGEHAGADGDASVTAVSGAALAVQTADCGSIALIGRGGAVAAVHAGWRGVVAGVLPATVAQVRALSGSPDVVAVLGPCIHPECYAFSAADLATVEAVVGPVARGTTSAGGLALDLPAALRAVLAHESVEVVWADPRCTACGLDLYSHRARTDQGRQALVVWIDGVRGRVAPERHGRGSASFPDVDGVRGRAAPERHGRGSASFPDVDGVRGRAAPEER